MTPVECFVAGVIVGFLVAVVLWTLLAPIPAAATDPVEPPLERSFDDELAAADFKFPGRAA